MIRRAICALAVSLLLAAAAAGQMQEDYLDVLIAKVKPEKRADFDMAVKKMADANQRLKGDTWVATEITYGEGNTISFTSARRSYADIEKGYEVFVGALNKAYGPAGAGKIFQDFSSATVSTRGEVRRRRWDLSANVPEDPAARTKLLGEARWAITTAVHVRPGQILNFEAGAREIKAARERDNSKPVFLVSQAVAGQHGTVFYFTSLQSSLGGLDAITPLSQALGEEGFRKFLSTAAESVESAETFISHFLPELSNAPEEVAAVAPGFWRPKPVAAAKPKPKAAEAGEKK